MGRAAERRAVSSCWRCGRCRPLSSPPPACWSPRAISSPPGSCARSARTFTATGTSQRVRETRVTLYLFCLAGNTLLTAGVGAALIYFSEPMAARAVRHRHGHGGLCHRRGVLHPAGHLADPSRRQTRSAPACRPRKISRRMTGRVVVETCSRPPEPNRLSCWPHVFANAG